MRKVQCKYLYRLEQTVQSLYQLVTVRLWRLDHCTVAGIFGYLTGFPTTLHFSYNFFPIFVSKLATLFYSVLLPGLFLWKHLPLSCLTEILFQHRFCRVSTQLFSPSLHDFPFPIPSSFWWRQMTWLVQKPLLLQEYCLFFMISS